MEEQKNIQTKSFTLSTPVSIIIAGTIVALAVVWGTSRNQSSGMPTATNQQQNGQTIAVDSSKVTISGEPYIGNPNAATVLAYWYDYQCPYCKQNEASAIPQLIKDYVDTGKLKVVFKDYAFLGDDSQTLGKYSRAVWENSPDKFYQWHKAIFDNQGTENTGWATKSKIHSLTVAVLGATATNQVENLVKTKGDSYQKIMDADKAEGTTFGVTGTPAMVVGKQFINGAQPYAQIRASVDAALAGK